MHLLPLLWPLIACLITFALYGLDKRAARLGRQRTRERTLHLWAAAGGWGGALVAQKTFRHKTLKQPFRRVFWLSLVPALAVMALCGWIALAFG